MIKNRTIAYIGLWVLLLPWLGFSNSSKNILVSITGALLLYLGNKHYTKSKLEKEVKKSNNTENQFNINNKNEEIEYKEVAEQKQRPLMEMPKKRTVRKPAIIKKEEDPLIEQ
jgi:hypothetical protein